MSRREITLLLLTLASTSCTGGTPDDAGPECPVGAASCPCTLGGGCDPGLICSDETCVAPEDPDDAGPGDESDGGGGDDAGTHVDDAGWVGTDGGVMDAGPLSDAGHGDGGGDDDGGGVVVCDDSCATGVEFTNNGVCEDDGPGSEGNSYNCEWGTDCSDCGPRPPREIETTATFDQCTGDDLGEKPVKNQPCDFSTNRRCARGLACCHDSGPQYCCTPGEPCDLDQLGFPYAYWYRCREDHWSGVDFCNWDENNAWDFPMLIEESAELINTEDLPLQAETPWNLITDTTCGALLSGGTIPTESKVINLVQPPSSVLTFTAGTGNVDSTVLHFVEGCPSCGTDACVSTHFLYGDPYGEPGFNNPLHKLRLYNPQTTERQLIAYMGVAVEGGNPYNANRDLVVGVSSEPFGNLSTASGTELPETEPACMSPVVLTGQSGSIVLPVSTQVVDGLPNCEAYAPGNQSFDAATAYEGLVGVTLPPMGRLDLTVLSGSFWDVVLYVLRPGCPLRTDSCVRAHQKHGATGFFEATEYVNTGESSEEVWMLVESQTWDGGPSQVTVSYTLSTEAGY